MKYKEGWQRIEELERPDLGDHILWNGDRFIGWLADDGWHDAQMPDHLDVRVEPQPTLFHPWPDDPPNG